MQTLNAMAQKESIDIKELKAGLEDKLLHLKPYYLEARNEIVEPEDITVVTQYFMKKWVSRLGPTLSLLIIRLRMYCYYNRKTREKRDWCFPSQETLAKDIGVSYKTIARELKKEIAKSFIRREARYVYNQELRKKVRTTDTYYIAMDDPLIPEDEQLLKVKVAEMLLKDEKNNGKGAKGKEDAPTGQFVLQVGSPIGQSVRQVGNSGEIGSPTGQFVPHISTDKLSEEEVLLRDTNNVNVNKNFLDKQQYQINGLVEQILDICQDKKSTKFYIKVASIMPDQTIYRALSEVKDTALTGEVKKSKGAIFTYLIKRYAQEQGIAL
jgi:DNA-binding MarR family transcriptional regulator